MRPSRKASTATSLAALSTAGRVPPVSPACRARSRAGKSCVRGASKCRAASLAKSSGRRLLGTRSGQVTAYWIGKHMSLWLSWAMTLLSTNSTMLWTMLCGCTTTSIWRIGTSNSQRASIISRPLLNRVAESMVILRPMLQVGCLSAWATVTPASWSAGSWRKGPPLAVSRMRRTSLCRWPSRHWKMALCSLSTGRTSTPRRRAAAMTASPAMTRISLLATARCLPASMAARAGARPATPTIATRTMSASLARTRSTRPWAPAWTVTSAGSCARACAAAAGSVRATCRTPVSRTCATRASTLRWAARPTTSMRSGMSRATLRALVPIEPVEPSSRTLRRLPEAGGTEVGAGADIAQGRRGRRPSSPARPGRSKRRGP